MEYELLTSLGLSDALSAILVTAALALVMLLCGPILLRLPRQLRHSWFYGSWAAGSCYLLIVGPFVLLRLYEVSFWAALATTFWLFTVGRRYSGMIVQDLQKHLQQRRGMFEHNENCPESHSLKRP